MDNFLIELKAVRKEYGKTIKTEVLKGLDLQVNYGEFLSIIGASGSGKSTLLNILGTLDTLTSGHYYFEGADIRHFSNKKLADLRNRKIGFIFQFHHLMPEFTALENVLMPYWISKRTASKEIRQKAEKILELVGIRERKDYKATNLSGGQQQRVAIARALMNEPSLVLADEPTGNLDSEATEQVYGLLRKINTELGTTFILVTHDRHIAAKSNRIIEIRDGNIFKDLAVKSGESVWDDIRPCNCMRPMHSGNQV